MKVTVNVISQAFKTIFNFKEERWVSGMQYFRVVDFESFEIDYVRLKYPI